MPIQLTCWFAALFHFDLLIHLYFDKKRKEKRALSETLSLVVVEDHQP
jgi:hypothetical protein